MNKSDIDDMVETKIKELTSAFKAKIADRIHTGTENAIGELKQYGETLKSALSHMPLTPNGLLDIIADGGIVFKRKIDYSTQHHSYPISGRDILNNVADYTVLHNASFNNEGKSTVEITIIIKETTEEDEK